MLEYLRRVAAGILSPITKLLSRARVSPHILSVFSLLAAIVAGYTYAVRDSLFPWSAVLLIGVSGFLDILDGSLARALGKESKVGAYLDSTFDRVSEIAIFTGILLGRYVDSHLVILALSFSLVVSYERARAETLGVSLRGVGLGERAERLMVLVFFTALSRIDLAVIVVLLLAIITAVHRLVYGVGSLMRIERAA